MNRVSWMVGVGAGMLCQISLADVPEVMDRMPADASVVVVMSRLSDVNDAIKSLEATVGEPMGGPAEVLSGLASLDGIDATKSLGMYIPAGYEPGAEPPVLALVPVADFDALVGALGGQVEEGIATLAIHGEPAYAKQAGSGYAVLSPTRELIEGYEATSGQSEANEARLGSVAAAAAASSDVFVAADIRVFAEQISGGFAQFAQQMQMVGMMGGQDMGAQSAMVSALGKRLVEDGRIGFIAVDHSDAGLQAGVGVQFNEGTVSSEYLSGGGDASKLLNKLPAKDFLFAYAADMSTAGAKKLNEAMQGAFGPQDVLGLNAAATAAKGMAMVMGESPGGFMGGALFAASSVYFEVDDPEAHATALKGALSAMNNQTIEGNTFVTSVEEDTVTVDDKALDSWSVRVQMNPQMGGQAQMAIGMLFGATGGPAGYMATTEDGLVMTLAKNAELAGEAIKAANEGDGLGSSAPVRSVAEHLPKSRVMETYVGVSNLVEMGMTMMAMMPGGPPQLEIPQDLAPIGLGLSTDQGAFELRTFAPSGVIKLFADLQKAMEAAQAAPPAAPPEENPRPRF